MRPEHVTNGFICHKRWLLVGHSDSVRAKRGSGSWHTMTEWAGNPSFLSSFIPLSLTHFFSDRLSRVSVGNVRNFCVCTEKKSLFSSSKPTKMPPLNLNVKVSLLCSHSPPIIWGIILETWRKIKLNVHNNLYHQICRPNQSLRNTNCCLHTKVHAAVLLLNTLACLHWLAVSADGNRWLMSLHTCQCKGWKAGWFPLQNKFQMCTPPKEAVN